MPLSLGISRSFKIVTAALGASLLVSTAALASEPYRAYRETVDQLSDRICKDASTTPDINACVSETVEAIDAELNRTYQKIMASFDAKNANQAEEKELLKAEEKLWIALRDAESSTVYQSNIEGTIRGAAALGQKRDATHQRVLDLKRRYIHLFYGEIEQKDFVGKWRDLVKPQSIFELAASGACTFVDGTTKLEGKCRRGELGLEMVDAAGKVVMSDWMYINHLDLGTGDNLVLEFLSGPGYAERVFVKES